MAEAPKIIWPQHAELERCAGIVEVLVELRVQCPCGCPDVRIIKPLAQIIRCRACARCLGVKELIYARSGPLETGFVEAALGYFEDAHQLAEMAVSETVQ